MSNTVVERVCGRRVVRVLPGGRSVLVREGDDEAGKLLVLKALPADCLLRGELHQHVRERLERVRELADVGVANLNGVEVDEATGRAMLVWDWVEGEDLPTAFSGSGAGQGGVGLMEVARGLVLAVERLHVLGVVHGAIHLRNILVCQGVAGGRRLVLTHVSPLVIDDVRRDAGDVVKVLRELNARAGAVGVSRGEQGALARVLAECGAVPQMGALREKLLLAEGARFVAGADVQGEGAGRSLWWALWVAGLGVGVSAVLWIWATGGAR